MANFGWQELLIILGILVLLFGATRLPKLARSVGSSVRGFKKGLNEDVDEEDEEDDESGDEKESPARKASAKKDEESPDDG